jgi:hypothetical protein
MARSLSLGAELLWLSTDPKTGKSLVRWRRRKRFGQALETTGRSREDAVAELERNRLLQDRGAAIARFRQLMDAVRKDRLTAEREVELLVLLTWTGVLTRRLSVPERQVAAWRIKRLPSLPRTVAVLGLSDGDDVLKGSGLPVVVRGPSGDNVGNFDYIDVSPN